MLTCSTPPALTRSKHIVRHPNRCLAIHCRERKDRQGRAHRRRPSYVAHRARPGHGNGARPSAAEPRRRPAARRHAQPPKSYSTAALLHPELAAEFEALQDRLRNRSLLTWQTELNARCGHGGLIREEITRVEVVELQRQRPRALDPHIHRHL